MSINSEANLWNFFEIKLFGVIVIDGFRSLDLKKILLMVEIILEGNLCNALLHLFFQTLTSSFRRLDTDLDGVITIHYEQFLNMVFNLKL